MYDSHGGKRSIGRLAAGLGLAAAAVVMASAAAAEQIRYPKDKPVVTMTAPDGWAVAYTPTGVEMSAPEKNAAVIAGLVKGDRFSINVWSKKAAERMMALGVEFDEAKPGKAPATAGAATSTTATGAKSAKPEPAKASAAAKPVAAESTSMPSMLSQAPGSAPDAAGVAALATGNVRGSSVAPSFSMFGDPTASGPNLDTARAMADMPVKGSGGPNRINGLDFKVAQYSGTRMRGRPVDVQLVIIRLSDDEVFLIEQASGSDDSRTVGIVTSTKSIL